MIFRKTLLAIFLSILPFPALAQGLQPFNFEGKYAFYWIGIPFGEMTAKVVDEGKNYSFTANIETTGLVKAVSNHQSSTSVTASGKARIYETNYQIRKKKKRVKMVFDATGKLTEHIVEPVQMRPEVPKTDIEAALDPLSYVMEMRKRAYTAYQKGEHSFVMNVFDGKRLTKGTFTMDGKMPVDIGDKTFQTIRISAKRTLLAGYTEKEKAKIPADEAPLLIYFSDDEAFIPLTISMDLSLGTAVMALQ